MIRTDQPVVFNAPKTEPCAAMRTSINCGGELSADPINYQRHIQKSDTKCRAVTDVGRSCDWVPETRENLPVGTGIACDRFRVGHIHSERSPSLATVDCNLKAPGGTFDELGSCKSHIAVITAFPGSSRSALIMGDASAPIQN